MNEVIRAFPWDRTPLGPQEEWPTNLRLTLSILLSSRFPMMLWWGEDKVQIYNDACAELIGPRYHPGSLGLGAEECWGDTWSILGPQIEQVTTGGGSTYRKDHQVFLNRDGYPEETFWTYSLVPVEGDGKVDGVLAIGTEVTEQHYRVERSRELSAALLQLYQEAANFVAVLKGPDHVFQFVNDHYKALLGDRDFIGKAVKEAVPDVAEQGFFELLDKVYETGEPFTSEAIPMRYHPAPGSELVEVMLQLSYQPLITPEGKIFGIFVEGRSLGSSADSAGGDEADCPDMDPQLSARETEVLRWTAAGKTAAEIAQILSISGRTVEFHINSAARKLDTVNRVQTVVEAIRKNLLAL